jgi:rhodanese-related sulfurtransferase
VARTIADLLADVRAGLDRLEPAAARKAAAAGAVLIDIRPEENRRTEGRLPGAVVIDRNVLEWRLDPTSDAALPIASHDLHVVLVCNEGYASSLAAATLRDLGVGRATDLIGGFRAWKAAGLPVEPPEAG